MIFTISIQIFLLKKKKFQKLIKERIYTMLKVKYFLIIFSINLCTNTWHISFCLLISCSVISAIVGWTPDVINIRNSNWTKYIIHEDCRILHCHFTLSRDRMVSSCYQNIHWICQNALYTRVAPQVKIARDFISQTYN